MIDAIHSVLMVAAGDELDFMLKIHLHGSGPSPLVVVFHALLYEALIC